MWWTDRHLWKLLKDACLRQVKFCWPRYLIYSAVTGGLLLILCRIFNGPDLCSILLPILGFLLVYPAQFLGVVRFLRMIRRQRQLLDLPEPKVEGIPLPKNSHIVLSGDWLLFAGSAALHRRYIKTMNLANERSFRGVGRYVLIVKTTDTSRYRLPLYHRSAFPIAQRWWKSGTSEENYGL